MEDLAVYHWLLLPLGPFIIPILLVIPGVIIALLVKVIIMLVKMARKRYNND
jgi:hypothetical protein